MVAQGTPEQVARVRKSYTGQALTAYFNGSAKSGIGKRGETSEATRGAQLKKPAPSGQPPNDGPIQGALAPTGTGESA